MAAPFGTSAFTVGEIAPAIYGRYDLARYAVSASTQRNFFTRYQGGASSRAGTMFVGFSKQTGRSYPPRLIPFQFNINQGLALEFGHFYMRVIQNGAFVVENPLTVTNITQADPAVVTFASTVGAASATPNTGAVVSSYAPGDTIDLNGGTFFTRTQLEVTTTELTGLQINAAGTGYAPGDTVTLAGGTAGTRAVVTVATVGGVGELLTFTISNAGSYTANPTGLAFTQFATSGGGAGATFRYAIMSPETLSVSVAGAYTAYPTNPVTQFATSGTGVGATFNVTTGAVSSLVNGDWVQLSQVSGMTQVNSQTYVIANVTGTTFELQDVYGNTIDTSAFGAYASGGVLERIYTLETPYAEQDLPYLKFAQSKDVMSLCLVNQITDAEYAPHDLSRLSNSNWEIEEMNSASTIDPPATLSGAASAVGTTTYQYVVTAINPEDGTESVASPVATIATAVNIAATAGTITLTWSPVEGVEQYNVYKASPSFSGAVPVGAQFGFAGSAAGTQFTDSNIIPDFTQVPPKHKNPFARGKVIGARVVAGGSGYTSITLSVTSGTGSGASLTGVLVGNALSAIIIDDPGEGYMDGDTITISGPGTGASAVLTVGPQTGTYPGAVDYFQQRRVYANTLNQPDTYFMSQPAAFTNFDSRIPTIDSDAITGNPWATQVNGIQALKQMPGGLIALTGLTAWQLTGNGGSSFNPQPITPSSQDAQPQAANGCHDHIPPIKIDYDILYVQSKGSIVRNASYVYSQNIYTGADLTLNCSHLFTNYQLEEWAWCEEPFKVLWAVRNDGVLLSLTFVKPQEIAGWGRHDTNGLFKSVCSVTEPPVDALYCAVLRFPGDNEAYMIERMDDRIWNTVEDAWCVDCALQYPQEEPDAVLTVSSSTGLGAISGYTDLVGGSGYSSNTTATIVDNNGIGPGTGASATLTIVGGVITAITIVPGSGYIYPKISFSDPENTGSGASAVLTLDNTATATASGSVFGPGDVGSVIRSGGGVMTITQVNSATEVEVNITSPITQIIPNSVGNIPAPQPTSEHEMDHELHGTWTMTAPVSSVSGLNHLIGMTVTGLYDGNVLEPTVVPANGVIQLPTPASAIVIGLGYICQLQTPRIETPGQMTIQGQRKKLAAVTVRVENSRGLTVGVNQPDGAALSPFQIAPRWTNMADLEDKGRPSYGSDVMPLWTGDSRLYPTGGFGTRGQTAIEQSSPLPVNVVSLVPEVLPGDLPEVNEQPRNGGGR